ncbi:hypothetical protein SAMN04488097_2049 [Epilithonimonas lactis]|nr:hypothetical protein SAMN04488097_2049 [Epilithonimonas lactis]
MKLYLFSILISLFGLVTCQTKSIQTISESRIEDTITKPNETKIYILKKQKNNSDFDYSKLNDIDAYYGILSKHRESDDISSAFEPLKGKYNYYQFIATFKGKSYNDGGPTLIKDFNDILII